MTAEIFRCLSGSRMYGTDLPTSDTDYKAVHIPSRRDILLGEGKDNVNTSTGSNTSSNGADDVDIESIRLQRFLQLAGGMQPMAVEMLFAEPIVSTPIWKEIVDNRDKILCKHTGPFVGYCRSQANRYAVRGERLAAFTEVTRTLISCSGFRRGTDVFGLADRLSSISGVEVVDKMNPGGVMIPTLVVFGRQASLTCYVNDIHDIMNRPILDAGKRSKDAHAAGGADWKAMYHAVRIAQEGIDLFTHGELVFPCPEALLLLKIRQGEMELEEVMDVFEERMIRMEDAVAHTDLRPTPDYEWINNFVMEINSEIVAHDG